MQTFKISETGEGEEFAYPKLIGLSGLKGVGKTTFAFQIGGHVISLASPIKKMLEVIVPKIYIYEEKEADIPGFPDGVNARLLMQTLGTEWGRNLYPDIWLNFVEEKIAETQSKWANGMDNEDDMFTHRIVVDDIRFENEAEMIRRNKGEVWRLKRAGVETSDAHISEAGVPDELIDKEILLDV
jgi:hypothetical protein